MTQEGVWTRWQGRCSSPYNPLFGLIYTRIETRFDSNLPTCKLTKIHHNKHFRDEGRTDLVKLLKKARQKRKRASAADDASGHKDANEETGSTLQGALDPAVDGAAALSPDQTSEDTEEGVVKPSFEYEDERALWRAQEGHIRQLTQEARQARAQKEQAEKIEVRNMREAFQVAEAMGVSGIEGANPDRPPEERDDSSQKLQLQTKFLEESIRKKESDLECPVCLEVTLTIPFWF